MPMPGFQGMYAKYAAEFKISIKRSGRLRPPTMLLNAELTRIGQLMVKNQKARWAAGINANGIKAKALNRRYYFVKKAFRRITDPIRDNEMTGDLKNNFTLRRASAGIIRAQPTARFPRQKAFRAEQYEEMIGFSPPEQVAIVYEVIKVMLKYAQVAWEPFDGPPPPVSAGPLLLAAPSED